jgi:predicted O-linked N-acetylglucosamine transferase (SPINDLY family)
LSGKTFANSVCLSLLKNIGLDELITKNKINYKNKVISLGKNPEQLRNIKKIERKLFKKTII